MKYLFKVTQIMIEQKLAPMSPKFSISSTKHPLGKELETLGCTPWSRSEKADTII